MKRVLAYAGTLVRSMLFRDSNEGLLGKWSRELEAMISKVESDLLWTYLLFVESAWVAFAFAIQTSISLTEIETSFGWLLRRPGRRCLACLTALLEPRLAR